jgi:(1->4)-alpha-D-glucan 1-alpha-D-glucosylmutase
MRDRVPTATYRLQFNRTFTFRHALDLVEYLKELGITAVYASPLTAARPGSAHGYDVIDPTRLNPELGTPEDFAAFTDALDRHEIGLILDLVPNHMCATDPGNRWWQDVLEQGPRSPYAGYFDIDFHPAKVDLKDRVLLPILGDQFGKALETQDIQVRYGSGIFYAQYGEQVLPLGLESWVRILEPALARLRSRSNPDSPAVLSLDDVLLRLHHRGVPYEEQKEAVSARLRTLFDDGNGALTALEESLLELNGQKGDPKSFDALEQLLLDQRYRVSFWRVAADEVNYRRFFDINDLVAIRVEEPEVFRAVHELALRLIQERRVTGLRIDHVDGLLQPVAYLEALRRLAREAGAGDSFLILVEKILGAGETLDPGWLCDGTTGYDFLNVLNGLFLSPEGVEAMEAFYERFTKRFDPPPEVVYRSKRLILASSMAGELHVLALKLDRISEQHRWSRDFTLKSLEGALAEVIACFPVYRTYADGSGPPGPADRAVIESAVAAAHARNPATDESIFEFLRQVLLLEGPEGLSEAQRAERVTFLGKFQQLTGPVMAKGLEDTACYRRYPIASVCEVGGGPGAGWTSPAAFHEFNISRQARSPRALSATTTHDTKRAEDVRARLNVLSEMPAEWTASVEAWNRLNAPLKIRLGSRLAPDANEEYLIYQTLVATLPRVRDAAEGSEGHQARVVEYLVKALREARIHSSWISPNRAYEDAVNGFVRSILSPDHSFRALLSAWVERISLPALWNTLGQCLLKITCPGIPDFYQGSEFVDLRLADPDNRRPVDFSARKSVLSAVAERSGATVLAELLDRGDEDGLKMCVIREALHTRRRLADLYDRGAYTPLGAEGPAASRLVAFARLHEGREVVTIAGRLLASVADRVPSGAVWQGTRLRDLKEGKFRDALTGIEIEGGEDLCLSRVLSPLPCALLERFS